MFTTLKEIFSNLEPERDQTHPIRNRVRHNRGHTTIERLLFKLTFLENIL